MSSHARTDAFFFPILERGKKRGAQRSVVHRFFKWYTHLTLTLIRWVIDTKFGRIRRCYRVTACWQVRHAEIKNPYRLGALHRTERIAHVVPWSISTSRLQGTSTHLDGTMRESRTGIWRRLPEGKGASVSRPRTNLSRRSRRSTCYPRRGASASVDSDIFPGSAWHAPFRDGTSFSLAASSRRDRGPRAIATPRCRLPAITLDRSAARRYHVADSAPRRSHWSRWQGRAAVGRDPVPESGHERLWQNATREKDIYVLSPSIHSNLGCARANAIMSVSD